MFKALFLATLLVTLLVNIIFLFATKDKPPDLSGLSTTYGPVQAQPETASARRLFLRSNDLYDYAPNGDVKFASASGQDKRVTTTTTTAAAANASAGLGASKDDYRAKWEQTATTTTTTAGRLMAKKSLSAELKRTSERPAKSTIGLPALAAGEGDSSVLLNDDLMNSAAAGTIQPPAGRPTTTTATPSTLAAATNRPTSTERALEPPRSLQIRVKSSRSHVFVSVDNMVVYESREQVATGGGGGDQEDAAGNSGRGIHVVVLDQFDGRLLAKRHFDTYSPQQDEELAHFVAKLQDGRLLVVAVRDEASFKMPAQSSARHLLQRLGSRRIMKLRWRDMWAFVARKRTPLETNVALTSGDQTGSGAQVEQREEQNLAEGLTKSARFSEWAPPVELEVRVRLLERPRGGELAGCRWDASGDQEERQRRLEFCSSLEGYGRVCDCERPAPISFEPAKVELDGWRLTGVPILVMASNRPFYLFRMLRSLLQAAGVNRSQVLVFIDGFYEEPRQVSRLFGVQALQLRPRGSRSGRISHHYKSALSATFRQLRPQAAHTILLEEDLDVSEDALVYFNQTLEVLERDESLYCVSAWNDQGYEHTAWDPRRLYRIETMPGLGWMLSRRLYLEELEAEWPAYEQPHDWDMWIRTEQVRRGRECIIPDVSRTFHFGAQGTNINSYFQRQYFSHHAFSTRTQWSFPDVEHMERRAYERHLGALVAAAKVLRFDRVEQLCSLGRPGEPGNNRTAELVDKRQQVIYIEMIDERDFGNWLRLAKCWRIWDLDARGQHQSVWRLHLAGVATLVVGAPASPHSRHKPADLAPIRLPAAAS